MDVSEGSKTKKYVLHHDEYGQSVPILETTDPEEAIKWLADRAEGLRGLVVNVRNAKPSTFFPVHVTVVEEQIAKTTRSIS